MGKVIGKVIGTVTGANEAAKSANNAAILSGRAAEAQQAEAQRQFGLINKQGQELQSQVMGQLGQYSVQELRALDQSFAGIGRQIENQEKLLASIDPTLMEASQQALKLLRGEKAQSLGPLEAQRSTERQQLVNRLREQFGPGAESSSIGINALNKFDSETSNIFNSAQQSSLGTLLNTTLAGRPDLNQSLGLQSSIGSQYGNIGARNASVLGNIGTARLGALSNAGQQLIGTAGAQFAGGIMQNQAQSQYYQNNANFIQGLAGIGVGALTGGIGGAAGAAASGGGGMPSVSGNSFWGGANPYAS